jgi:serine/threonine protein kinase
MTGETGTLGYMAPEVHTFCSIQSISLVHWYCPVRSYLHRNPRYYRVAVKWIGAALITVAHTYVLLILESFSLILYKYIKCFLFCLLSFFRSSRFCLLSLPEEIWQVLNGSAYNRKCDVYSFGICLWEIYCCDMPYPDLSFSEVTSAVVRQVNEIH